MAKPTLATALTVRGVTAAAVPFCCCCSFTGEATNSGIGGGEVLAFPPLPPPLLPLLLLPVLHWLPAALLLPASSARQATLETELDGVEAGAFSI